MRAAIAAAACLLLAAAGSAAAQTPAGPSPQEQSEEANLQALPGSPRALAAHRAVTADPPRHPTHPARNRQLLIESHGSEMNALFFLAAGEGPKPTLLLLHGLPGNERNLDLAQAVRRAGWNVLTFTYRGAWGSQGRFSIGGAIADTHAAMAFLRTPEAVRAYGIDPKRIVVGGHSMGGFAAALGGAIDREAAGIVLLDAWDIGETARRMREGGAKGRAAFEAGLDDLGHALNGATARSLAAEVERRGRSWHIGADADGMARKPVLIVSASEGNAAESRRLAAELRRRPGARVTEVELESDHAFADKRVALAETVVGWLLGLGR
jgi:pimeloyl-ACP methyl ester carboxylesterase